MTALPDWPYPPLIAHRGGGVLAPENTLAGLRAGRAHGYDMAEYDAKLSLDRVPLLMHDDTVDRTTDGTGAAAQKTYAEMAALDAGSWHSPPYAGEPVPALRAVARYTLANGMASNVEIKPCPGREAQTGTLVAQAVRELWREAARAPLLSSFSETALAAAARAAPELPRALLLEAALPHDWLERLRRHGCIALNMNERHITAEIAERVRAAGFRLGAWTVNDPARAALLRDWGVDSLITDRIDLLRP
ncbi:glycerophosphodiester phosphodiesterase [Orrella sp. JC864]|uniref:glycerophosphodiester phosphodiesterase n=1 Tax=Orrella sp. JC864 TaxID=3120298 RepID=UPI0012BC8210